MRFDDGPGRGKKRGVVLHGMNRATIPISGVSPPTPSSARTSACATGSGLNSSVSTPLRMTRIFSWSIPPHAPGHVGAGTRDDVARNEARQCLADERNQALPQARCERPPPAVGHRSADVPDHRHRGHPGGEASDQVGVEQPRLDDVGLFAPKSSGHAPKRPDAKRIGMDVHRAWSGRCRPREARARADNRGKTDDVRLEALRIEAAATLIIVRSAPPASRPVMTCMILIGRDALAFAAAVTFIR